ncbi:MAG: site-2 protease family protein, partial [Thermoanaerobaculia bacterium]
MARKRQDGTSMFGHALTLFRLRGFDVRVDLSWVAIFVLLVWSLAQRLFPRAEPELSEMTDWILGIAGALCIFGSIVLHELAHASVAKKAGIDVRAISLFLFGGVIELNAPPRSPRDEVSLALAGPATSFILAGALFATALALAGLGVQRVVWTFFGYMGGANVVLAAFNLIPTFPLDGGRLLRAWLWHRTGDIRSATRTASSTGSLVGFTLIGVGLFFLFTVNFVAALWWILVGFYVRMLSQVYYSKALIRQSLVGEKIRRFTSSHTVTAQRTMTVRDLVETCIERYQHRIYPVMDGDRLIGCVSAHAISLIPRNEWDRQTVGSVTEPLTRENSIEIDTDALEALVRMTRRGRSRLIVIEGEDLRGVVTIKDLMSFLAMKIELES